jgi:hypothetical protein
MRGRMAHRLLPSRQGGGRGWVAAIGCLALINQPATARTLQVGPDAEYRSFADAVAKAHDGDTIDLAPGEYFECAMIRQRDLTLQGAGDATVITDRTCYGKGLLVVQADNLTVRDLVLARARVPDLNGAGVRLEANGLLLERVRFLNNQVGVLAGQAGSGEIVVRDCTFRDGGVTGERPTAALLVAGVARLLVERSSFSDVKGGQISTGAARTELLGNRIETGVEPGASYAVLLNGGALLMRDNVLALGPNPPPRNAAVLAVDGTVELRGNRLLNTTGQAATLLIDWSGDSPVLADNVVGASDTEWGRAGLLRHRAGSTARAAIADARSLAGSAKRGLKALLGR